MSATNEMQMEIDGTEELIESSSVESVPSCSSSILNTPVDGDDCYEDDDDFEDGINVTILSTTTKSFLENRATADQTAVTTSNIEPNLPGNEHHTRLNGAARKRYKRMVGDGMNPEEAYRLARIPLQTPNSEKRARNADPSESNSSGENPRKKKNLFPLEPKLGSNRPTLGKFSVQDRLKVNSNVRSGRDETTQSDNNPTYSAVVQYIRVGIVPKNYPDVELSSPQLLATRKAILAKVVQQRKEKVKPKFGQCSFRTGHLILVCKNQETADWLKSIVSTLTITGEVELIALDEKKIPRPEIIIGFFPVSAEDSTDEILALLESQNDELYTDEWRIKERNIINQLHVELIFTVDGASMNTIRKCEFVLDYKFGNAPLRRKLPMKNKAPIQVLDNSSVTVGNSGSDGQPTEQPTALTGVGETKQTTISLERAKDTGEMASGGTLNPSSMCLPGTSGIGKAANRICPKKIPKEPHSNETGLTITDQNSPGPKRTSRSKRHAKNSPASHRQENPSSAENKNTVHKNKYIAKYINSLGTRETNTGVLKTPQESDTVVKNASGN